MKKIILILSLLLVLTGCNTNAPTNPQTTETPVAENNSEIDPSTFANFKILAPGGAPALALLPLFDNVKEIDIVDGPDNLQVEFTGPSNYDIVIAPTNLGVRLASMDKTEYRLGFQRKLR